MSEVDALIDKVVDYHPGADADIIRHAYAYSKEMHRGQRRQSGDPYFVHPVGVANLIADLKLDESCVCAGLLHDVVEDTLASLDAVEAEFGDAIAGLVDGVTKISQVSFTSVEEKQAENFRKMIMAMARDIRVILIKLADRADNMRTLEHLSAERQRAIAKETLEVYAPIAHRLGINWIKNDLEDNALRFQRPEVYYQLKRNVAKKKAERRHYIDEFKTLLAKELSEGGVEAEVVGRPKHFYSIYSKMQRYDLLYDQIYDLVGFRVLVDSVTDCYVALGLIHAKWKPVPGRVKDYIAMPKNNRYQSLHTTVIGMSGERVEVQIRTREMHRVSEFGIAAHWSYKEGEPIGHEEAQRFAWLRQLVETQQKLSDPHEFLGSIKEDLFSDEVYVYTPGGDVLNFPEGATAIDFAYRIHSEVGQHCAGARVNGRLVPLDYQLSNGEMVEIVTTAGQTPSKDWLGMVKTSRAKTRIRAWLRHVERGEALRVGGELLDRDLRRHRMDLKRLRKNGRLAEVASGFGLKGADALVAYVGYGRITARQVLERLLPAGTLGDGVEVGDDGVLRKLIRRVTGRPPGVRVSGAEDVLIRFAKCCDPLPGEEIRGFITRGRGVTVHTSDCTRVLESDPQRQVEVAWESGANGQRPVQLEVRCLDKPGMLAAITKSIGSAGVNISSAQVQSTPDQQAVNSFEVIVQDAAQLHGLMRSIGKVRGVLSVRRPRD